MQELVWRVYIKYTCVSLSSDINLHIPNDAGLIHDLFATEHDDIQSKHRHWKERNYLLTQDK